ncbi:hypothetical protein H5410_010526 [Solanum commersonii]|uniref:Uncharacterized protein n=1 Tax=Solanum commersonii TaxID=4109 RepID=A0A9J6ALT5_SOLCO|nr:hypothetical protein H5410_010526 [Solanum commersonii]
MDANLNDNTSLRARIKELERERDELHKDIEQLCMQQSGPGYIGLPTHVPLHRIAGLEQETENLKKKLAACTRENQNLQEELSEAYHIKGQLANLHSAEVSKNIEAEKQLKFFQGCVAAAFSQRDHAVMEAEKAKEKEGLMSRGFHELQQRVRWMGKRGLDGAFKEVLSSDALPVFHKFYEIRQQSLEDIEEDVSWEDKYGCLLHDSSEMWTFSNPEETSTLKYIVSSRKLAVLKLGRYWRWRSARIEENICITSKASCGNSLYLILGSVILNARNLEFQTECSGRTSGDTTKILDNLQNKLQVILSEEKLRAQISAFHHYHSQHRLNITSLLDEGFSHIKSAMNMVEEKLKDCSMNERDINSSQVDNLKLNELERQDRNQPSLTTTITVGNSDASKALAVALNEKVETLLLLSQQEERHLLERNVNAALQEKMEELQRNLLQVTNEKVKALHGVGRVGAGPSVIAREKDGRLKNLLKTSYLRRWTGLQDSDGNDADTHRDSEANFADRSLPITWILLELLPTTGTLIKGINVTEYISMDEDRECNSKRKLRKYGASNSCCYRRLRLSLFKKPIIHRKDRPPLRRDECITKIALEFKEPASSKGMENCSSESLDNIINEASQLKTALGISLPLSWSVEADSGSFSKRVEGEIDNRHSTRENIDFVSATGFEMVELLVFVAQLLKENKCS